MGAASRMVVSPKRLPLSLYRLIWLLSGRIFDMQKFGSLIRSTVRKRGTINFCAIGRQIFLGLAILANAHGVLGGPLGIAWQVKGLWQVDGHANPIQTGDAIEPGALLRPIMQSSTHSITILLPDGQRILYECFLAEDCARGFRVPLLSGTPDMEGVHLLWRIHATMASRGVETEITTSHGSPLPRDEAVVILGQQVGGQVQGLASALANGTYTYTVRALDQNDAPMVRKTLEKTGSSVSFDIPLPGLYDVIVTDGLNTPR